jgi:hypothetical protein
MNRLADVDDGELRPQIRLLAIGAVISLVLLGGSLGIVLGGLNDPVAPQLPGINPAQTSLPDLPSGFPTGLPTSLPTDFPAGMPTGFPAGFPTSFPTGLIPTDIPAGDIPTGLPSMSGGNP